MQEDAWRDDDTRKDNKSLPLVIFSPGFMVPRLEYMVSFVLISELAFVRDLFDYGQ